MTKNNIKKVPVFTLIIAMFLSLIPTADAAFWSRDLSVKNEESLTSESFDLLHEVLVPEKALNEKNDLFAWSAVMMQGNALKQLSSIITPQEQLAIVGVTALVKTMVVSATAYSSTPDQTDSSPFITAKGTHVRDGIIAANFLPFDTLVKIPDLYGDKVFVVEDRMNKRYQNKIDVWFPDRQSALEFGLKTVRIEIVGTL